MTAVKVRQEDIIACTPVDNNKIYIREETGHFQKIRRYLNVMLVALFVALPFLQYQGQQAILFDVGRQTLTLFKWVLYPQDLMIFALLFILAAFVLFLVTRHFGRVWCGFTCPQTVWTLAFNWIERRIEGTHNQSKALDKQPNSLQKVRVKILKHGAWLSVSTVTALVFMSYFYPATRLYGEFFTFTAPALISGWTIFFAVCTYANAGWLREKMCTHMCPYSRFQAAMFDNSTSLVTYNDTRGERRGPRKRFSQHKELGDCVDCNLCVQVCPAGIDIRDGIQYECINCGLCIDACDKVMTKFGYAQKLINYTRAGKSAGRKFTNYLYGAAIVAILLAMVGWALDRQDFEASISRDRNSLYRENIDGHIENTYTLTVLNKTRVFKTYDIGLIGTSDMRILNASSIRVAPGEKRIVPFSVEALTLSNIPMRSLRFEVIDRENGSAIESEVTFYSGQSARM
ncbi:cytochrome c oxidase accessory protein CcoG [Alteromonas gracilis]|uniref:cytochrome c oxidase accessory protein CcoG n=1 Tax=Alteromonas gracilis TaxID=1479524 RepID=UPI003735655E